ncbi:unnamed protein product, partial [Allacma fusca]
VRDLKPANHEQPSRREGIPKHPVSTLDELEKLNAYCFLPHNASNLASSLTLVGGRSLKDATANIMAEIMSDGLAMGYNWAGTKRGETHKLSFKNLKLVSVVYDAIRKMRSTGVMGAVQRLLLELGPVGYFPTRQAGYLL